MAFVATAAAQKGPERTIGSSPSSLGGFSSFVGSVAQQQQQQQREFQVVQRYSMAQPHHYEDTKPSTHDFLSLYDKGSQQVENGSNAGLSSSLTTHDFLQPLEKNGGRSTTYREAPKPARAETTPVQSRHSTTVPGDRMHPNYATIQVPYAVAPNSMIRMVGETEALRQSRGYPVATLSSSREDHGGGPESLRGVEVAVDPEGANARENLAYWPGVRFKFGIPSDLTFPAGISAVKTAVENGHQSIPAMAKQWAQAAQGMIEVPKRPARPPSEEDDDDDEDSSERLKESRREPMSHKDSAQRMDSKNADLRACTPRSKHSATEQRRRSKINDRFQMLRDLVPHSDQKRDKASFLLEVIEYIQVLQNKVRKFENVEQGRHQERLKSMVWDLCKRGVAGSGEEISQINALVFAKDFAASPADIKPVTEAVNADVRSPRASEQAAAPTSEGCAAGAGASQPACSIHSCVSSLEGEKENATALTAQPLAVGVSSLQQAIPLPYALPIVVPSKAQRDGRGAPASNSVPSKDPDTVSSLENAYNPAYMRSATPDHQFEVRPRFSLASQADQIPHQQSKASEPQRPTATFAGRVDGAQACQPPGASARAPRQQQQQQTQSQSQPQGAPLHQDNNVSKQARHLQSQQPDHAATPGDGSAASLSPAQPFPGIQGGVINVSSVYSQGLLDTLTRALQSSGVDLSKANISVQIDLGQNATVAAADTSVKVATTPESSAQSHQSQGRTRPAPMAAAEPEPALKRPKLETH